MAQPPSMLKRVIRLLRRRSNDMETANVSVRELAFVILVAVIVVGGFFVLRGVTTDEAERDTRERVVGAASLVVRPTV